MTTIRTIPENIYNQYVRDVRSENSKAGFDQWKQRNYPGLRLKEMKV